MAYFLIFLLLNYYVYGDVKAAIKESEGLLNLNLGIASSEEDDSKSSTSEERGFGSDLLLWIKDTVQFVIQYQIARFTDWGLQQLITFHTTTTSNSYSTGASFGAWLGLDRLFGYGEPHCGPPSNCPPHHCRYDPAVIHGYCCGCAAPYDAYPYICPLDTQCPVDLDKLCDEFSFLTKCCCPGGIMGEIKPK